MLKIFHSDRFVPKLPEGHRFPISKYQLIREQLLYEGSVSETHLEESYPVEEEHILMVHEELYWSNMRDLKLTPKQVRRMGFPQSGQLVERSRRSCQGTLSAAIHAAEHGMGMNIAGGTHHAYPSHGEGFCLLNDLAISAKYLLDHKLARRILIVDLDVHQGNGTAVMCAHEPRIFTLSLHGAANYPLRKEISDLDVPLPTGMKDNEYLHTLQEVLPKIINRFMPDYIFFQSGVDVLETDRLGKLSLSKRGCKNRDRIVIETCAEMEIPLCVCIGGGYSPRLADTVEAHANTFRVASEVFG